MIKYRIHADYILAKDGDRHFITERALIRLYEIPPNEATSSKNRSTQHLQLINLYPNSNGIYNLK